MMLELCSSAFCQKKKLWYCPVLFIIELKIHHPCKFILQRDVVVSTVEGLNLN